MANLQIPSPEFLSNRLRYEPDSGKLFWRDGRRAGKEAFTYTNSAGYKVGNLGRVYLAHRVIWAISTGEWPSEEIDHVNGIRVDNRLCNLREASSRDNKKNRAIRSDNTHGVPGLSLHKRGKKRWQALISTPEKRNLSLGYYATKEEAIIARRAAEKALGYSPRHGR
jgi:hypothetical protein